MTKAQMLLKLYEVDNELQNFCEKKPKINPQILKKAELEQLLNAIETMYEIFKKCSDVKGE